MVPYYALKGNHNLFWAAKVRPEQEEILKYVLLPKQDRGQGTITQMREHPFFSFAVKTVQQASLLARQIQLEVVSSALEKTDRSPVAVADFVVQAFVGCLLDRMFPRCTLVAEEDSTLLQKPESATTLHLVAHYLGQCLAYVTPQSIFAWLDKGKGQPNSAFWVLDPIDGTKGFLRGEQYAIALSYIENGIVQFGVLGCPNLAPDGSPQISPVGAIAAAERGRGAWIAPLDNTDSRTPLHVTTVTAVKSIRVLRSVESSHTNETKLEAFCGRVGISADPVRLDSQAKYAVIAAGHAELLLRLPSDRQPDYRECIWDQAAGSILVEEAGGKVTDVRGQRLDFSHGRRLEANIGVVASNGHVHEETLEVLRALLT